MNYLNKSREELLLELQELHKENNTLKNKYEEDILVQKQVIESLEFKEEQHKAILGSALSGFWRYDLQGRLLEVNEEYCRMSGYSERELLTMRIPDLEAIEDNKATAAHLQKIIQNGCDRFESQHRRKDGSIYDVEVDVQYLDINGGQILGFHTDITARKQTLNRMFENEQMFRDLMQNSPIGEVVVQLDRRIINVNTALCDMVGYSKEEFITMGIQDITHPDDVDTDLHYIRQMLDSKINKYQIEKRFVHKDKHIIWILLNVSFVLNNDGSPKYFIGQIQDVTDRKNNELELMHHAQIEKVFNEISYQFVCSNYLETDTSINTALKKLGLITEVDRVYVFQLEDNETTMSNLFEWCNKGIEPQISNLQQLPVAKFPWWMAQLNNHKIIQFEDISDLPAEAVAEYKIIKDQDITSILVIPMFSEGRLIGYIGFDSVKRRKNWIDTDVKILKTLSDLISGELSRTKRMFQLIEAKQNANENENKFKKLSNLTFEGIIIHKNGIAIDINKSFQKLSDYSNNELIGKNVIDIVVPKKYHPIINKNHTIPYQIEIINKEGILIPVEFENKYIDDNNSDSLTRVVAIRDMRERRKAEKEIKKLSTAVKQSANTIVITDVNGIIEYINHKFTELTGYSAEYLIGKNLRVLNSNMQLKEYNTEMWKTISAGNTWKELFNNKKENGELSWEQVTISPIKNNAAEIINYLATIEDVTALKENEQKLKNQNIELIKAKEKAEESDRLKSAFLANMSHEIRTPMNGILGFTELLLAPDLTSEQKEKFIKIVHKSGKRMLKTVTDIVEISKIEAGVVLVNKKEINVNGKVEELINFFKYEAKNKGLKLSIEKLLPITENNITTDLNKLDSILTNLIKNAIKYTDSGTINIGCRTHDSVAEFYIKDTGIGIPAHRQEAIFERFIQADISDKRAFEGSGLGLAISKSYVEMLGGNIWVESEEGVGSTFYFTLPIKNKNEEESTELVVLSADNKKKKPMHKKLKILIAEDDETSRKYISLILNDFHPEILYANNGIKAVELCRNNTDIDLILMDIRMPHLNGYDATRRIREFNKTVIIIAQTAYVLSGDMEKSIESGCNDYISKPVNKNKLKTLIQKYFGNNLELKEGFTINEKYLVLTN